jgi:hypothetical protein
LPSPESRGTVTSGRPYVLARSPPPRPPRQGRCHVPSRRSLIVAVALAPLSPARPSP